MPVIGQNCVLRRAGHDMPRRNIRRHVGRRSKCLHLGCSYWAVHLDTSINDEVRLLLTGRTRKSLEGKGAGRRLISLIIAYPQFQRPLNDAM